MGFVVDSVELGQHFVPAVQFPLSVSYSHCPMLIHSTITEVIWPNQLTQLSYKTFHQIHSSSALRADSY